MGIHRLVLDPPGYYYAEEPGYHWTLKGSDFHEKIKPNPKSPVIEESYFLNPPGSEWIMPRPRQFAPEWWKDPRVADHILRSSKWTFATGITADEWEPKRRPDNNERSSADKWITIAQTPTSITSLDATDYNALATACGSINFPSGMGTVATCSKTPTDAALDEEEYTPRLEWLAYPEPDDALVFGFSNLAAVLYRDVFYLCRSPKNDRATWELLYHGAIGAAGQVAFERYGIGSLTSVQTSGVRGESRSLTFMPVGYDHLYVYQHQGEPVAVRLRDSGSASERRAVEREGATSEGGDDQPPRLLPKGGWWIGAPPKRKIAFQCQVVGYEVAGPTTSDEVMFDTGDVTYKPTIAPECNMVGVLHGDPASFSVTTAAANELDVTSTLTNEAIHIELLDEDNTLWNSDGTHHSGKYRLYLYPSNPGTSSAFLAPQVRLFELRFPVKLTARKTRTTTIYDADFKDLKAEVDLEDPDGKRLSVTLTDTGVGLLTASGLDGRGGYPIHWEEGADTVFGTPTLRGAFWVESPDTTEYRTEGNGYTYPVRNHQIQARGLLHRADEGWLYLPQMVTPNGSGFLEHTDAVQEALIMAGFDVTDSTRVYLQTDPQAGTAIARLPGTWGHNPDGIGEDTEFASAPKWDESKLDYIKRIAEEWRGWWLYERLNGQVRYEQNKMLGALLGLQYHPVCTIYRNREEAIAALGAVGYRQYFETEAELLVRDPEANAIRISGKEGDGSSMPHVLIKDRRSTRDPFYENFLGEWHSHVETATMAVSERDATQLAAFMLLRKGRRQRLWSWTVPLAPWQFLIQPLEVGLLFEVQARGTFLCVHLETSIVKRLANGTPVYQTRITGDRMPTQALGID